MLSNSTRRQFVQRRKPKRWWVGSRKVVHKKKNLNALLAFVSKSILCSGKVRVFFSVFSIFKKQLFSHQRVMFFKVLRFVRPCFGRRFLVSIPLNILSSNLEIQNFLRVIFRCRLTILWTSTWKKALFLTFFLIFELGTAFFESHF